MNGYNETYWNVSDVVAIDDYGPGALYDLVNENTSDIASFNYTTGQTTGKLSSQYDVYIVFKNLRINFFLFLILTSSDLE